MKNLRMNNNLIKIIKKKIYLLINKIISNNTTCKKEINIKNKNNNKIPNQILIIVKNQKKNKNLINKNKSKCNNKQKIVIK